MSTDNNKTEKPNLDPFYEWAVWGQLESEKNYELILLKGHLLLEAALESLLLQHKIDSCENYSFHRKISFFESLDITEKLKQKFIVKALRDINNMRNKLAHEFKFDINNGEFDEWSSQIHQNLQGMKWTRYTHRTKIVHSFSILAINILNLKNN
ncbi:MAG: hypothetical protein ACERKD_23950 [Prolixibacteraceae bacterium]